MTDIPNSCASAFDAEAFQRSEEARTRLSAEALLINKTVLFDALAAAGIGTVEVRFDGYGDSGQIEEVTAQSNGAGVALPEGVIDLAEPNCDGTCLARSTVRVADAIETLAYRCLEDVHDGWENNDGAYGDFIFDVTARTITLAFNARFTDSVLSEHCF